MKENLVICAGPRPPLPVSLLFVTTRSFISSTPNSIPLLLKKKMNSKLLLPKKPTIKKLLTSLNGTLLKNLTLNTKKAQDLSSTLKMKLNTLLITLGVTISLPSLLVLLELMIKSLFTLCLRVLLKDLSPRAREISFKLNSTPLSLSSSF